MKIILSLTFHLKDTSYWCRHLILADFSMQTPRTRWAGPDSENKNIGRRSRFCATELRRLVRILLCKTKMVRLWPFFVSFWALAPTIMWFRTPKTNTKRIRVLWIRIRKEKHKSPFSFLRCFESPIPTLTFSFFLSVIHLSWVGFSKLSFI